MSETSDAVAQAMEKEAEAADNLEAARTEETLGGHGVSLDLIIESIRKEREGLDKLEEGIQLIQQSLDERRRGLDQQEQLLSRLLSQLPDSN